MKKSLKTLNLLSIAAAAAAAIAAPDKAEADWWLNKPNAEYHVGCGATTSASLLGTLARAESKWIAGGVCAGAHSWETDLSWKVHLITQTNIHSTGVSTSCSSMHSDEEGTTSIGSDNIIDTYAHAAYIDGNAQHCIATIELIASWHNEED